MEFGKFSKIAASILICHFAGLIGSVATYPYITTWYASLQKPFFNPPNWLFGPAWLILYTLMGISLYLVWEKGLKNKEVKRSVVVFGVQLALNSLWSVLFFGLKNLMLAFIEIIALWAFIAISIVSFYKISKKAALLLVPYILWVSFAALLNYSVWMLNM